MVTPTQQRAAAEYLCQEYEVSQRRAGQILGRARSTLRYTPRDRSEDEHQIGVTGAPMAAFDSALRAHGVPVSKD